MEYADKRPIIVPITQLYKYVFFGVLGIALFPLLLAFFLVLLDDIVEGSAASTLLDTCIELTKLGWTSLVSLVVGKGADFSRKDAGARVPQNTFG